VVEVKRMLLDHLEDHYALYGEFTGVRTARKHIGWYVDELPGGELFRERMNALEDSKAQAQAVADFFDELASHTDRLVDPSGADAMSATTRHMEMSA
jgi:tRNA-dihydrouridine synthase B